MIPVEIPFLLLLNEGVPSFILLRLYQASFRSIPLLDSLRTSRICWGLLSRSMGFSICTRVIGSSPGVSSKHCVGCVQRTTPIRARFSRAPSSPALFIGRPHLEAPTLFQVSIALHRFLFNKLLKAV